MKTPTHKRLKKAVIRDAVVGRTVALTVLPAVTHALLLGLVSLLFRLVDTSLQAEASVLVAASFIAWLGFGASVWLWFLRRQLQDARGSYKDALGLSNVYVSEDSADRYGFLPNVAPFARLHILHPSVEAFDDGELTMLGDMATAFDDRSVWFAGVRGVLLATAAALFTLGVVNPVFYVAGVAAWVIAPMTMTLAKDRVTRRVDRQLYEVHGEAYLRFIVREMTPKNVEQDVGGLWELAARLYVGRPIEKRFGWVDGMELGRVVREETESNVG